MKDISELMLDRLLEMQKRVIELEQKLAVVQEREAIKNNTQIDIRNPGKLIWDKNIPPMFSGAYPYMDQYNFQPLGKQVDSFYSNSVAKESEANKKAEQHAQAAEAVAEAESLPEIPDGFIRHDGEGCPVDVNKTVSFFTRGKHMSKHSWKACKLNWLHNDDGYDIIAYKVIEE